MADSTNSVVDAQTRAALMRLAMGFMPSRAIHLAAKLGIADMMADGPKSSEHLAEATGMLPDEMRRYLRALAALGVLTEIEPGRFELAPLGTALRSDQPHPARAQILLYCDENMSRVWEKLPDSLREGRPIFKDVLGAEPFEYAVHNPELSQRFNDAMAVSAGSVAADLVEGYDFSQFGTLVDVGGNNGTLISKVLAATPGLRGVIYDVPPGLEGSDKILEAAGVADRCEKVAGDFFTSVPEGGDAYLIKSVIYDWDDEKAGTILRNCRRAMKPGSKLLVVEAVLPERVDSPDVASALFTDLHMMLILGGRNRTEAEFRKLYADAGFELTAITDRLGTSDFRVIEGVPV